MKLEDKVREILDNCWEHEEEQFGGAIPQFNSDKAVAEVMALLKDAKASPKEEI